MLKRTEEEWHWCWSCPKQAMAAADAVDADAARGSTDAGADVDAEDVGDDADEEDSDRTGSMERVPELRSRQTSLLLPD